MGSLSRMTGGGEVLTSEQMEALQAELAELEGPRRAAAIEAIATARAFGDLSENFEYHAAKNEQGLLEARITKLRARISAAMVVDHDTDDHVGPGSIVEIADEQGDVMEVTISSVGGGVSPDSPLGVGADGQGRRGRRRGRGAARGLAGDGPLDPARVSGVGLQRGHRASSRAKDRHAGLPGTTQPAGRPEPGRQGAFAGIPRLERLLSTSTAASTDAVHHG